MADQVFRPCRSRSVHLLCHRLTVETAWEHCDNVTIILTPHVTVVMVFSYLEGRSLQQSRLNPTVSEPYEKALDSEANYLICFSHLRWNFVYQRPQHLMSRFSRSHAAIYFEEPEHCDGAVPALHLQKCSSTSVTIATPRFPRGTDLGAQAGVVRSMLDDLLSAHDIVRPILWFYTPMMFSFASHIEAAAVVYDCMDELSHFRFAPPELPSLERALMTRADVMFTGGMSLYDAKRTSHPNIHAFPSSVDTAHFLAARTGTDEPADQAIFPGPRLGFYGVVDERMDVALLEALARAHPDWSVIVIGPVVKIDPATLPVLPNLHYFGGRSYGDLPRYLGGWNVALMPFALNDATRFISPTKTLEYLAGGKQVVSTPVKDVVRQYSGLDAVRIGRTADEFIAACEEALATASDPKDWIGEVDALLATLSWDKTFQSMAALVRKSVLARTDCEDACSTMGHRANRVTGDQHPEMVSMK